MDGLAYPLKSFGGEIKLDRVRASDAITTSFIGHNDLNASSMTGTPFFLIIALIFFYDRRRRLAGKQKEKWKQKKKFFHT